PGTGVVFPTIVRAEEIQRGRVDGAREHRVLADKFGDRAAFRARTTHDAHRFQQVGRGSTPGAIRPSRASWRICAHTPEASSKAPPACGEYRSPRWRPQSR